MKRIAALLLTLTFVLSAPLVSYAMEGWQQEGEDWYYYRDDNKLVNEWIEENGEKYYVGPDGKMYTDYHLIDGYYYCFYPSGRLSTGAISDIWRDHKVIFSEGGKGTLTEMTEEDALYSSSCVKWMDQTYGIYTEYLKEKKFWASLYQTKLPSFEELLARDWGITDKESGISMVHTLFERGVAEEDKAMKAWDLSRAMLLCKAMRGALWMEQKEYRDLQYAMAPTIQQSFSSWQDLFDNYMLMYRNWENAVGSGSINERIEAYESVKKKMNKGNDDEWIPWDKQLVKYW